MSLGTVVNEQTDACAPGSRGSLRQMPLAVIDQMLISAVNFITIVLLARARRVF